MKRTVETLIGILAGLPLAIVSLAVVAMASSASASTDPPQASSNSQIVTPAACLLVTPEGEAPTGGWPVFLLLHGYGANKEDLEALAKVVASHGAAAICVDAPNDLGGNRRNWEASTESTHAYLQEQIAPLRMDRRLDFEPMHVGGFSEGASRALSLIVNYETVYGGALPVSPIAGSWPAALPAASRPHPVRLVHGAAEGPAMIESAHRVIAFWTAWGQPLKTFTHPGGHQFPSDWAKVLGEGVDWILEVSTSK